MPVNFVTRLAPAIKNVFRHLNFLETLIPKINESGWQIPNCNGKCKDFQDLLIVFALQVSLEKSKTTQKKMSKLRDVSLPTKAWK